MSKEESFLEQVYAKSELMDGDGREACELIFRSFNTLFWMGNRPDLDLKKVLELIDHSKISDTEKITFLTSSIECNNQEVYRSESRKNFCKKVKDHFEKTRAKNEIRGLMMGLE